MTTGRLLGLVVLRVSAMFHGALANYVDVANISTSDGGSQLRFTLLPAGLDFARWATDTMEVYTGLLSMVALVPHLGADLAKLFAILLS